jgi:DNA-directed RNA polymerase specialized sigma24 family protein
MKAAMDLAAALHALGPLSGNEQLDGQRRAALETLWPAIQRLARIEVSENADDVAAVTIQNLLRMRGAAPLADSEAHAVQYLRRVVRNAATDIHRRAARLGPIPDDEAEADKLLATSEYAPDEMVDAGRLQVALAGATKKLFDEIAPAAAVQRRTGAARAFQETVARLRRIAESGGTVSEWVTELSGLEPGSGAEWDRERNRVDQRISRTLRALREEIERKHSKKDLSDVDYAALCIVHNRLRPRVGH